jgi:hypothetical protein
MSSVNPYAPPAADLEARELGAVPALWNPNAAGAWSLLFTPIFGSILLLENWRAIGMDDKVKAARWWLIASALMFIPTMILGAVGFIYLIVWYFAWQKPQARFVTERWGSGYPRKSWGKPLLIGFGCWLGFLFLVFLVVGARAGW